MNSLSRPERGWKRGGTSGWKRIYMSLRQLPRAKTKSESNIDTGAQFCRNFKAFVCMYMSLVPNNKTIANFFFQQDFASAHNDKAATKYWPWYYSAWLAR